MDFSKLVFWAGFLHSLRKSSIDFASSELCIQLSKILTNSKRWGLIGWLCISSLWRSKEQVNGDLQKFNYVLGKEWGLVAVGGAVINKLSKLWLWKSNVCKRYNKTSISYGFKVAKINPLFLKSHRAGTAIMCSTYKWCQCYFLSCSQVG